MNLLSRSVCTAALVALLGAAQPVPVWADTPADDVAGEVAGDTEDTPETEAPDDGQDAEPPADGSGTDAPDDDAEGDDPADEPAYPDYTGWADASGEPCDVSEATCWLDEGIVAASKFFYDPLTNAWYWAEADTTIARDHEAFVPTDNTVAGRQWEQASDEWRMAHGKWVHLGEDGAVDYGFLLISDGQGGAKWVFCDYVTGEMAHGERYIDDSHGDDPGWMYFDPITGAVDYGWAWLPDSGKWVYYDEVTGRMRYGSIMVDGTPYFLDPVTGEKLSHDAIVRRLIDVAASQNGITDGDRYQNAVVASGGTANHMGPCCAYVYWCFKQAGLTYQYMDGTASAFPHEVADWYRDHGRLASSPKPGDIWLIDQPAYRPWAGASAGTHAGIVAAVAPDGSHLYVWEHIYGRVQLLYEDIYIPDGSITGFARPNYNDN